MYTTHSAIRMEAKQVDLSEKQNSDDDTTGRVGGDVSKGRWIMGTKIQLDRKVMF